MYTLTSSYERDELCPLCSAGTNVVTPATATLNDLIQQMLCHPGLGKHLSAPSVSFGTFNLYVRGALEDSTRINLEKPLIELLDGRKQATLTVNDRQLPGPLRVRVQLQADCDETMKL